MRTRTPYGKATVYSAQSHNPQAERVVVVPGYSETIAHSKKVVDALAMKGFNASTFSQPRRAGKGAHRIKDPIQRQGSVVLSLIEATVPGDEKVHAVAHSLGSAAVLRAAQKAPDRFASITLMQPLGMAGEQGLSELAGRVSRKVIKNLASSLHGQSPSIQPAHGGYAARVDEETALSFSGRVAKAQLAGNGVIVAQPALSLREALAAGQYEVAEDIANVAELGIPIHLVTAHDDELFDNDKVHTTYEAGIEATSYSSVADPDAGHDTFWMQPERTARIVSQLIQKA